MQKIEQTDYGFRITNSGRLTLPAAEEFKFALLEKLSNCHSSFSLFVDIRGLIPLEPKVVDIIKDIMSTCAQMSIERVAIIVTSPVVRSQHQQMSHDSLTTEFERIIDANKCPDWEERGLNWVRHGIEPVTVEA